MIVENNQRLAKYINPRIKNETKHTKSTFSKGIGLLNLYRSQRQNLSNTSRSTVIKAITVVVSIVWNLLYYLQL